MHKYMNSTFTDFIESNYKDLMLWYHFGANRDDEHHRDGKYMYPVKPEEGTLEDPEYYFEKCDFVSSEDPVSLNLRKVDDKLYWVHKISHDIYRDKEAFLSLLCCYDFTEAVYGLLKYASGSPQVLFHELVPAVLGYKNDVPIGRDGSLLPLLNRDGTYIVQYDFDTETHAFVLLREGDKVTIVNYYNGSLYIMNHSYYEAIGILWLVERNDGDNRPLLSTLLGLPRPELYPNSEYHVTALAECYYWDTTVVGSQHYKNYLRDVIRPLFVGRAEGRIIESIVSTV